MRSNEVDPTFEQAGSQRVAVSSGVVNQLSRPTTYGSVGEQRLNKIDFMGAQRFSIMLPHGVPLPSVNSTDAFVPLPRIRLAYAKAPFSRTKTSHRPCDSSRSIFPCRVKFIDQASPCFLEQTRFRPLLQSTPASRVRWKRSGRSRHRTPPVRKIERWLQSNHEKKLPDDPPRGDGSGSSKRSEIRSHWSSVSSNSGSILGPTLNSASAEWDRCDISLFPFANCTHNKPKRFDLS